MTRGPAIFDPLACDLCGDSAAHLVGLDAHRALCSDRTVVDERLEKRICGSCGLMRRATPWRTPSLEQWYREGYRGGAPPSHQFFTGAGRIARSSVFGQWLQAAAAELFDRAATALDYGTGTGELLVDLRRRWPRVEFHGLELNPQSAGAARDAGFRVHTDPASLERAGYDVISAVAVLEHSASPRAFLAHLRTLLRPRGHLLLAQHTQDVLSLDVAFADHLFHFATPHVARYARAAGFRELRHEVGVAAMPTYSLHVWQAVDAPASAAGGDSLEPPAASMAGSSIARLQADIDSLDRRLDESRARGERVAVFGLGEAFAIAACYSTRLDAAIAAGAVDDPDRPEYSSFRFPVVTPERLAAFEPSVVLVATSAETIDRASARVRSVGLRPVPIFSSFRLGPPTA